MTLKLFILVFARVLAMMLTAPIFGSRTVGMIPRAAIAFTVSLLAFPIAGSAAQGEMPSEGSVDLATAIPGEILVGALLGLGVTIIFSAAEMAGSVIGQMAGISISGVTSPVSGDTANPVSGMFGFMSLAVFALIGGPELLVTSVLDTFVARPPGTAMESAAFLPMLTTFLQHSFSLTLRGVAPAVVAMLISTVVIGMVGRSYPQINMLTVGLNSNMVVMFLAVFLTLGGCMWLFVDDFPQAIEMVEAVIASEQGGSQ
ncbi:MAG: flagellar biosynthetic protein FliR [Planctomycetota bacterium]